jgi:hypothetical protein
MCLAQFEALSTLSDAFSSLIEVFAAIVAFSPVFDPSTWMTVGMIESKDNVNEYAASFLYHNLMVRDPQYVRDNLPIFLGIGWRLLQCHCSEKLLVLCNFHSGLLNAVIRGSVPNEYFEKLIEEVSSYDILERVEEFSVLSQFMLVLIQYDATIVIERLMETMMQWFDYAEYRYCASALALLWTVLDDDWKRSQLARIMGSFTSLGTLTEEVEDTDRMNFEKETNFVQGRAIEIYDRAMCRDLLESFLRELVQQEPEYTESVSAFLGYVLDS